MDRLKYFLHIIINFTIVAGFLGCLVFVLRYVETTVDEDGNEVSIVEQEIIPSNSQVQGSGTVEEPFLIRDEDDLKYYADAINRGEDYCDGVYSLENDIELSDKNKGLRIGTADGIGVFRGTFYGNGHTVSGFDQSSDELAGMFIQLTGSVFDLNVEGKFKARKVGAVACLVDYTGVIANCSSNAKVDAQKPGGIACNMKGIAVNCAVNNGVKIFDELSSKAIITHCFNRQGDEYVSYDGSQIFDENDITEEMNLFLGKMNPSYKLVYWEASDDGVSLTRNFANRYTDAKMHVLIGETDKRIDGFFSTAFGSWCFVLPAFTEDTDLDIVLSRENEEKTITLSRANDEYSEIIEKMALNVKFLTFDDAPSLFLDTHINESVEYIYASKRNKLPGYATIYETDGGVNFNGYFKEISCRGNSSYSKIITNKNSMCIGFDEAVNLLGLPENDDYVLLSGYRDNSLLSYIFERTLFNKLNLPNSHDFRMVNVYIDGLYMGLYMLTGSQEIAKGRFDIDDGYQALIDANEEKLSSFEMCNFDKDSKSGYRAGYIIPNSPADLSGGYVLEVDTRDFPAKRARFKSKKGTVITMKSGDYSSMEQVNYVADFWQDFENAVYSENGQNSKGKYYSDYLDLKSMANLCALYEITADSAVTASVYFYKDSDASGDGKLHAGNHWDAEHSFMAKEVEVVPWLTQVPEKVDALHRDAGFFPKLYSHERFVEMVKNSYKETYRDAILSMLNEDNGSESLKGIVDDLSDSDTANSYRWEGNSMIKKYQSIREFLKKRMTYLDRW